MHYREATVADVPAMEQCRRAEPSAGPADERMVAYLESRHHPQQALVPRAAFVAEDSGMVVGYIAGHLTRRFECEGEIQYLYVAPMYRGRDVARRLLAMQAHWFLQHRAHKIGVNVEPENSRAVAFYKRQGAIALRPFWLIWHDIRALPLGRSR